MSEDYRDAEGFLCCGLCRTRKEADVPWPDLRTGKVRLRRVGTLCECRRREAELLEKRVERVNFEADLKRLRETGLSSREYLRYTFADDDLRNREHSNLCRKYVELWERHKANNTGLLLYGDTGTGKSFLAGCIANALLQHLVPVTVMSFPQLLPVLYDGGELARRAINRVSACDLLVIDDLGVESGTETALQHVFRVVDARALAGKPLIVTTNLSLERLKAPVDLAHKRIYDRILGLCPIRIRVSGPSRREAEAEAKRAEAVELMRAKSLVLGRS